MDEQVAGESVVFMHGEQGGVKVFCASSGGCLGLDEK